MLERLAAFVHRRRGSRRLQLLVVNLRILLGFALLPSGLKKVLGEPFTDPSNTGPFHDFLHAFHATGAFYTFVGATQVLTAFLLMTQRRATLGAALLLPILTVILVFCWSTAVYPTASVVTLMFLGALALVLWDIEAWRGLLGPVEGPRPEPPPAAIATRLWEGCGLGIFLLYLTVVALTGEIYRPRGLELDEPAFYLLPLIALFPVVTWRLDRRHRR